MMELTCFSDFLVFAGIMFVALLVAGFGREARY